LQRNARDFTAFPTKRTSLFISLVLKFNKSVFLGYHANNTFHKDIENRSENKETRDITSATILQRLFVVMIHYLYLHLLQISINYEKDSVCSLVAPLRTAG